MDPVFALSISGPLTDIGAVAGLVAIPGIAILSLLYFTQAREVKRLREWAGRAPERAQELQERVAEQAGRTGTIPPQPAPRVVAQPAGRPAGAAPATAAAAPGAVAAGAAAKPGAPQQPAPAGAPAASAKPATAGAATTAKPAAPGAKPVAPGATPGAKPAGQPAPPPAATPGGGSPKPAAPAVPAAGTAAAANAGNANANAAGASAPSRPPAPAERPAARPADTPAPARRAQPLRSSRPSASPTAAGAPPRGRRGLRARLGRRGAAIASGLVLLLVVGGLVIATQTGGGGTKAKPPAENTLGPASQATKTRTKPKSAQPAVQRGSTTVAVLNGTTSPGLAATVSDQLSRGGFKRGNVTNAADQQQSTTAVLYAPGFKTAADEIASLLKLKSVQPIDPGTQAIAGSDAQVVVTVGTDRTQ